MPEGRRRPRACRSVSSAAAWRACSAPSALSGSSFTPESTPAAVAAVAPVRTSTRRPGPPREPPRRSPAEPNGGPGDCRPGRVRQVSTADAAGTKSSLLLCLLDCLYERLACFGVAVWVWYKQGLMPVASTLCTSQHVTVQLWAD
jgi:hypothetical protein